MTVALPFHEVTSEIAARTSPTLLDLLLAVFCALMATYTTIRQTADTTAAAAGTAIGIALVFAAVCDEAAAAAVRQVGDK
jgi:uncharacterized membrane protein